MLRSNSRPIYQYVKRVMRYRTLQEYKANRKVLQERRTYVIVKCVVVESGRNASCSNSG